MPDIAAALGYAKIKLNSLATGSHKTACPKCGHGKYKNRQDLSVTITSDDVVFHCHRPECAFTRPRYGEDPDFDRALYGARDDQRRRRSTPKPAPVKPDYKAGTMSAGGYKFFEKRGISKAIVDANKITMARQWLPQAQKKVECIAFPFLRAGEVVNIKFRGAKKAFAQVKGAEKIPYGLDTLIDANGAPHETAIWLEGEVDALSVQQAGLHQRMGVLSVPDGAPVKVRDDVPPEDEDAKFSFLWNAREQLRGIKKHIIATDNDDPGHVLAEELARRLGKEKCWVVQWPTINDAPRKDANEVLTEDGAQVLRECVDNATPWPIRGLHTADAFRTRVFSIYRHGRDRGLSTGWPSLDQHMTVVPGMFTVITGVPGSGKSEFVDNLCMNLAENEGWRFAMCSFENDPGEDHLEKLAEKRARMPFWDGPTARMGEGDLAAALDWLTERFFFIHDEQASPTIDWILEKASAAVQRHGVKGLVVDPYNEIEHTRAKGVSETDYVGELIGKCKRFARTKGCHVWFVAHPAKLMMLKNGTRPVPSLYDISGSANWYSKCDIGLVVHRAWDKVTGQRSNCTEAHVKKVRHRWMGRPGLVRLYFDTRTGRYREDEHEAEPAQEDTLI